MKYKEEPFIYKFRHFEDSNHIRLLRDNEVYFSPPNHFHDQDSNDCQLIIHSDCLSLKEFKEYLTIIGERRGRTQHDIDTAIKRRWKEYVECKDKKSFFYNDIKKTIDKQIEIFCVAADCNNKLLWEKHANNYTGYCVCLKNVMFQNYLFELFKETIHEKEEERIRIIVNDCHYIKEIPVTELSEYIKQTQKDEIAFFIEVFTRKKIDFEWENEIRFIWLRGKKRLPIWNEMIDSVILGKNISYENKETIIDILKKKSPYIKLYQGVFDHTGLIDKIELKYQPETFINQPNAANQNT